MRDGPEVNLDESEQLIKQLSPESLLPACNAYACLQKATALFLTMSKPDELKRGCNVAFLTLQAGAVTAIRKCYG